MKNIRSRKGVTIIEVVIALAIITMISAVTLSLIVMSEGVETKAENALIVKNAAENAVECYRFAKSYAQELVTNPMEPITIADVFPQVFYTYLGKMGAYTAGTMVDDVFTSNQSGVAVDKNSVFRLVTNGCIITITQNFTDSNLNGFTFIAKDAKGEEIYNFTYPAGGDA